MARTHERTHAGAALGTYDANLAVHDSVLATDHVVGFVFTMRCDDGWYVDSLRDIGVILLSLSLKPPGSRS